MLTRIIVNLSNRPPPQVRFSPNMCCYTWLVSGGRTGLVRLNCLKSMINTPKSMTSESRDHVDPEQDVQTVSEDL